VKLQDAEEQEREAVVPGEPGLKGRLLNLACGSTP
jgi:hypothetical protein